MSTSPATPAATPSPRPRGAARRVALLEATLRVVADAGVEAVTHRRVAEAAGLPLASTTYWFASKDELLIGALALACERDTARLEQLASEHRDDRGPAAADAALEAVIDPLDEPGSRASLLAAYTLLLEAARRPQLRAIVDEWNRAYIGHVGALLQRAGSRVPEANARMLLATTDGLLIDQLATGQSADPRPDLRRLVALLIAAETSP